MCGCVGGASTMTGAVTTTSATGTASVVLLAMVGVILESITCDGAILSGPIWPFVLVGHSVGFCFADWSTTTSSVILKKLKPIRCKAIQKVLVIIFQIYFSFK
jgi:hypothetical protein